MRMKKAEQNRRMSEFQERCRALGLSVTYQRLAIYRALIQLDGRHPTPDDVYRLVRRAYPSISLATVYKTLERLERAGLVARPSVLHETARYEHRVGHHHHLVCVACKRLEDVLPEDLGASALPSDPRRFVLPDALRREYEVLDWSITFKGLCRACRKAGAAGNGAGGAAPARTAATARPT